MRTAGPSMLMLTGMPRDCFLTSPHAKTAALARHHVTVPPCAVCFYVTVIFADLLYTVPSSSTQVNSKVPLSVATVLNAM